MLPRRAPRAAPLSATRHPCPTPPAPPPRQGSHRRRARRVARAARSSPASAERPRSPSSARPHQRSARTPARPASSAAPHHPPTPRSANRRPAAGKPASGRRSRSPLHRAPASRQQSEPSPLPTSAAARPAPQQLDPPELTLRVVGNVIHNDSSNTPDPGRPSTSDPPSRKRATELRLRLSTKINTLVDALGNPIGLHLTGGQVHDLAGADHLLPHMPTDTLIADKAFDAEAQVIGPSEAVGKRGTIPPKANRRLPRRFDRQHCKAQHSIDNFFTKLKRLRAIATPYERTARKNSWRGSISPQLQSGSIDDRP